MREEERREKDEIGVKNAHTKEQIHHPALLNIETNTNLYQIRD
jgi:hypothetical protein